MAVQAHHSANNLFHSSYQFLLANRDSLKVNQDAMIHHETLPIHREAMNIFTNAQKRPRDQETTTVDMFTNATKLGNNHENDTALQIQRHHCDVDHFLTNHTERVRVELEKQRKREARIVVRAFEERIAKRLKEKDDEMVRVAKLNWGLQERVKALRVENQLWKELAQSNQATAVSLRTNLDRVLDSDNDAESCCGVVGACKGCGEEEAKVLVLPCRHLCLCAPCGSHLRNCPVCHTLLTASVRVNFEP